MSKILLYLAHAGAQRGDLFLPLLDHGFTSFLKTKSLAQGGPGQGGSLRAKGPSNIIAAAA
jgi:hypothetical protein